jgi:hypothetical protein
MTKLCHSNPAPKAQEPSGLDQLGQLDLFEDALGFSRDAHGTSHKFDPRLSAHAACLSENCDMCLCGKSHNW